MDKNISDFHLHLNGSISHSFLEKKLAVGKVFNETYPHLAQMFDPKIVNQLSIKEKNELVGKAFADIHQVITTHKEIIDAVFDAVKTSKANYLELRTSPKILEGQGYDSFFETFHQALEKVHQDHPEKMVRGLMSINRNKHDLKTAQEFLKLIKKFPTYLIGFDISGYPPTPDRALMGEDLKFFIQSVLSENLPMAIHVGESDLDFEYQDTDYVLEALNDFPTLIATKVRLGHCIYLTAKQISKIKKWRIPIEVCPSCHEWIGWWKNDQKTPHPVTLIYQDLLNDPVVCGTDDFTLIGSDILSEEIKLLKEIYHLPITQNGLDPILQKWRESSQKYRF